MLFSYDVVSHERDGNCHPCGAAVRCTRDGGRAKTRLDKVVVLLFNFEDNDDDEEEGEGKKGGEGNKFTLRLLPFNIKLC